MNAVELSADKVSCDLSINTPVLARSNVNNMIMTGLSKQNPDEVLGKCQIRFTLLLVK